LDSKSCPKDIAPACGGTIRGLWFSAKPTQKPILTPKGVAIALAAGLGFEELPEGIPSLRSEFGDMVLTKAHNSKL